MIPFVESKYVPAKTLHQRDYYLMTPGIAPAMVEIVNEEPVRRFSSGASK
jgi:hypothetical protein